MLESLSSTVVLLRTDYQEKVRTSTGTAVLVADQERLFLVTAGHVANDTNERTTVTMRIEGDRPLTFPLPQLSGNRGPQPWVFHDHADVAVLRLQPVPELMPYLKGHFLPRENLLSTLEAPSRERPLVTLGFPLGLGVRDRFSPISRESKAASGLLTLPRADRKGESVFFLLDSPSIGGFSGAPVFHLPGAYSAGGGLVISGRLECVGLVHGTISDDTGGKLAAIVPAQFISEALEKARGN